MTVFYWGVVAPVCNCEQAAGQVAAREGGQQGKDRQWWYRGQCMAESSKKRVSRVHGQAILMATEHSGAISTPRSSGVLTAVARRPLLPLAAAQSSTCKQKIERQRSWGWVGMATNAPGLASHMLATSGGMPVINSAGHPSTSSRISWFPSSLVRLDVHDGHTRDLADAPARGQRTRV